jgi:hypothetical protein
MEHSLALLYLPERPGDLHKAGEEQQLLISPKVLLFSDMLLNGTVLV